MELTLHVVTLLSVVAVPVDHERLEFILLESLKSTAGTNHSHGIADHCLIGKEGSYDLYPLHL